MSAETIRKALDDALLAFATTNSIPVAWEGTPFNPSSASSYLSVRLAARVRSPKGYGRDTAFENSGTYLVTVFFQSGTGVSQADAIADLLIAAFYRGLSLATLDSKQVVITSAQARPAIIEPSWVSVPVAIDWFSYE